VPIGTPETADNLFHLSLINQFIAFVSNRESGRIGDICNACKLAVLVGAVATWTLLLRRPGKASCSNQGRNFCLSSVLVICLGRCTLHADIRSGLRTIRTSVDGFPPRRGNSSVLVAVDSDQDDETIVTRRPPRVVPESETEHRESMRSMPNSPVPPDRE